DMTQYDCRETYTTSYNFSMADFQAALGRSQLKRLDSFIKKRREIAERYDKVLCGVGRSPKGPEGEIIFRYVIEVECPEMFIEKMGALGVACAKPVFRPLHRYLGLDDKNFPNTSRAHSRAVSIPIYPSMTEEEIRKVEGTLKSVLGASG
ncbi:MAG: DegT/DnrJ/EryC1/StrS family aminotransferase, partial [Candidatus Aenigmatarchaeota archaeon]